MLKLLLKLAVRNFARNKSYALINVVGLTIGITCCMLAILYVQHELSYDMYHENTDRIYRIVQKYSSQGKVTTKVSTPSAIGSLLQREFPGVELSVRIYPPWKPVVMRYGRMAFKEEYFYFADSTVFDIFTFPFIMGDPKMSLVRPNTIVITRSTAQKYFGDTNPIGEILVRENTQEFEVTGVIEDIPENSHFRFDFLASYSSLRSSWAQNEVWHTANFMTYLLLKDTSIKLKLAKKIPQLIEREIGDQLIASNSTLALNLQPLKRIHLFSHFPGETNGEITNVYAFSAIAILILLIACINYMNFATARSVHRAREVAIRKVVGAFRNQVSRQFFAESAIVTFLALFFSILLTEIVLPFFNEISDKTLTIQFLDNYILLSSLIGIWLFVSLTAGCYPALILSRFQPVIALRGTNPKTSSPGAFRNKLVVFQFMVSIALIVATFVVYKQLAFAKSKELGFNKGHILVIPIDDSVDLFNFSKPKS